MPFQELPAGKRFDAEHNMLFLLAALADIQHIIIILYITPFQIKAALPGLLRKYFQLKGRNSLRSNSLPFFTPEIQPPLDAPSVRPGDRSDGKL